MKHFTFFDNQPRHLVQREALSMSDTQPLWRLGSGALRIDSTCADGVESLVRLALPGDLVGMEAILGVPDRFAVRALTDSCLLPVDTQLDQLSQLLMACVVTSYQRSREMVKLRTGSAEERIRCLLLMLASNDPASQDETAACAIPSLSDIAAIVHVAPETVCRVMANLRQVSFLQESGSKHSKHIPLAQRIHRLQARAPSPMQTGAAI